MTILLRYNDDRSVTLQHGPHPFMVIANDHGGAYRVRMFDPRHAPAACVGMSAGDYVGECMADVFTLHRSL